MQLQNKLDAYPRVKNVYLVVRRSIYFTCINPFFQFGQLLRKLRLSSKYKSLRNLKNQYCNKKVFIIATGPSLTKEDYLALKDQYTIGVNAICKWFGETGVTTNWLVVSDPKAYKALLPYMPDTDEVFTSDNRQNRKSGAGYKEHRRIPVDISNNYRKGFSPKKISNDIEVCAYNGNTVVLLAIQIAIYMGFRDIYLVGTDCNYDKNVQNWYSVDHGIIDKNNVTAGVRMIRDYMTAYEWAEIYGVNIYNATRGGMLEVFPRVNLDALIELKG